MSTCKQWREGDEMACTCGLRWGTDEKDPHPAKAEAAKNNIKKLRKDLNECKKI